jgi:predicted amidohydrolase YtcJ
VSTLVSADAVRTAAGVVGNAVLLDGERIVAVGDREHLLVPGVTEDRYPGSVIVPGLVDTHIHPVGIAGLASGVDLHDAGDLAGVVDALRTVDPGAGFVVGHRLDEHRLDEGRLPNRVTLDAVDHPVLVYRVCGHVAVANTAALALAGVDRSTVDPPGGSLDRDDLGTPTGVLREEAIPLVANHITATTGGLAAQLVATLTRMRSEGLTRLGAILSTDDGPWCAAGDEVDAAVEVGRDLPITLHAYVATTDIRALEAAAELIRSAPGDRLRFAGIKLFADGSYGGATAAMRTGEGTVRMVADRDRALAEAALALGGDVAIHAIGDGAVTDVLDLFESLIDAGTDPRRLRMEHASTSPDDLVERMATLGIGVAIQPAFVASEHDWLPEALGDRAGLAHRFGSLHRAGVRLGGGSDSPVEPSDPLWGMRWARERAGFLPDEAVDGATALGWWTNGAHDLLGIDPPLEPGSVADLTILSDDPTNVAPAELGSIDVVSVWTSGTPQPIA